MAAVSQHAYRDRPGLTHMAYSNLLLTLTGAAIDIPYIVTALVVRRFTYYTSPSNVWLLTML